MPEKIVVNVETGERQIVELTPDEVVAANAAHAAWTQQMAAIVPQQISDRQFFQMAAIAGLITESEALAAVATGAIPAVLQSIVDGIQDADQKFGAKMLLSGATVFERNHPLTEAVGASLGWTSEQIDQFFTQAATL